MHLIIPAFLLVLICLLFPIAAAADGGEGILGFLQSPQVVAIAALLLALVEVARRAAQLIPGKRDDEIVGTVGDVLRSIIDFLAGNHGVTSDSTLVQRRSPEEVEIDEDWEADQVEDEDE